MEFCKTAWHRQSSHPAFLVQTGVVKISRRTRFDAGGSRGRDGHVRRDDDSSCGELKMLCQSTGRCSKTPTLRPRGTQGVVRSHLEKCEFGCLLERGVQCSLWAAVEIFWCSDAAENAWMETLNGFFKSVKLIDIVSTTHWFLVWNWNGAVIDLWNEVPS